MKSTHLIPLILFIFLPLFCFSQNLEPEDPGIELPPIILEIADLVVEDIEAFLPREEEILPSISIILPEPGALIIEEDLFTLSVEDSMPGRTGSSAFFSDGTIGFGSRNHILGDISLYKTGDSPRFSLRYYHEQWDGFHNESPGSGFFSREDAISGGLSLIEQDFKFTAEASFLQDERGLQGHSDYSTLTHRFYEVAAEAEYRFSPVWAVSGGASFSSADILLSGDNPSFGDELKITPGLILTARREKVFTALSGSYTFSGQKNRGADTGTDHSGDINLLFQAELPSYFDLILQVGAAFRENLSVRVPFSALLAGQFSRFLSFSLEGGYRAVENSYTALWREYPYLDLSSLVPSFQWFAELDLSWYAGGAVTLDTSLVFENSEAEIRLNTGETNSAGLFSLSQFPVYALTPSVDLRIRPSRFMSFTTGFYTRLLDTESIKSGSATNFLVSFESEGGRFGTSLGGTFRFAPKMNMPELKWEGFYRLSEGVLFMAEIRDFLAPLLENGRSLWDPYIEPGFVFILKTQISL